MRNMVRVTRFTLFPLVAKLGALLLFLPPCSAGAAVRGAEMVVPCAVSAFDDTLEWLCALKDPAGAPLLRVDEIFPAERPRVATLSAVGPLALRAGLRNAPWLQLNFVAKTVANSLLPMLAALFSGGGGDLVHYVEAKTVEYGIGICRTRFGRSDAECNLRF